MRSLVARSSFLCPRQKCAPLASLVGVANAAAHARLCSRCTFAPLRSDDAAVGVVAVVGVGGGAVPKVCTNNHALSECRRVHALSGHTKP